jgi:hypothetical protein
VIDDLELQIARLTVELTRQGADHRYIPLLVTAPGFGWINAFTVASEIGDIERFASPAKLCGYTGLCPRVFSVRLDQPPRPDLNARPALSALGPLRGRHERVQTPALRRALPTHQAPARPPTRPQGRPDRTLAEADRSGLAHAHPQPTVERTASRSTFGQPIIDHGVVQRWISESRIRIEQARLLVLKTAWLMDTVGNRGARVEISAIKVAAADVATFVIDRAIQAHGGAGVSQDHLLAELYAVARILQIADGPDEVHHMAIARRETRRYREPVAA